MDVLNQPKLTKPLLWLMAISACLVVANNYYNQPLLGDIAREFSITEEQANRIATMTLVGYAVGLLLFVPLGDKLNKRYVIIFSFFVIIASLLSFAHSNSYSMLILSSFFIGLSSVVPQMFVPLVAQLSTPNTRSKNVGFVMTGLLIGILASRTVSGVLAQYKDWRFVYEMAAFIILLLAIANILLLPNIQPTFKGTYFNLLKSVLHLAKRRKDLRLAALRGALSLACFQAFWTTLTFYLEGPPFFKGSETAGLLSLVGIGGALSANFVGKIADSSEKKKLLLIAAFLMIVSWGFFSLTSWKYIGLIIGIFLIDVGLQSLHVTNQSIIFSKDHEATNRINTVYMTAYFSGGALGAYMSGICWHYYHWSGVVGIGTTLGILLLLTIIPLNRNELNFHETEINKTNSN